MAQNALPAAALLPRHHQAAAGFYHASRHNRHGTQVKLSDSVCGLAVFPSEYLGVDTGRLRDELAAWLRQLRWPMSVLKLLS